MPHLCLEMRKTGVVDLCMSGSFNFIGILHVLARSTCVSLCSRISSSRKELRPGIEDNAVFNEHGIRKKLLCRGKDKQRRSLALNE